ncbi:MAG: glycosyltransferase family 9 protein [Vampirovibrionales bacterium]|nr:glycosyltransferase family 9 protein [Vampirovibrionales bacterium]
MTKYYAIIRLGALGDCIHVLPTLAAWHRQEPDAHFVWITSPALIPLLQSLSEKLPITFIAMQKPKGWLARISEVWRLLQELRPLNLQGVLNLHPNALTWILSNGITTGWVATYNKQKLSGSALQRRTTSRRHAVDDFYEPLRKHYNWRELAGAERYPALPIEMNASTTPKKGGIIGMIMGVGNQRPNRAWPLNHWEVLTHTLLEPNTFEKPVTLWFIGGPDERPLADALMQRVSSPHLVNHCGAWTLPQLAENLTRCDLVIGGDTGPLHVAGAVGANVLGLYAPTAVDRTGPLGSGAIQTLTPPENRSCWPCEAPKCPSANDCLEATCMAAITPEQVVEAVKTLLSSKVLNA